MKTCYLKTFENIMLSADGKLSTANKFRLLDNSLSDDNMLSADNLMLSDYQYMLSYFYFLKTSLIVIG
jgi:hypothetical protein